MEERTQCEFQLIRYVPDPVKNEFINIGVLLRAAPGERRALRFTRDWRRVRCLDPDVDTQMLEALEIEIAQRFELQLPDDPKPILATLETSLSNGVQITPSKAYLAESFVSALEDLMRLHVDPPKRERSRRHGGRGALVAAMRRRFEDAGVWTLMRHQIAAADYTIPGDPLRIDCGYENGMVKMFQTISLETNGDDAKLLAFAAPGLKQGVKRLHRKDLLLTAIIEPIGWPEGEAEPEEERGLLYNYVTTIMEEQKIRVMTSDQLPEVAQAAREELKV